MHSKIYKAKLIAVYSAQQQQKTPQKTENGKAIHAYFGMLQHIFQRNKHMIRQLKLSGMKIQSKKGQEIRVSCKRKKTSELYRSTTKHEKQITMENEELTRQKSLPNYGFLLTSFRNRSVQPREVKEKSSNKYQYNFSQQQKLEFVPIGQASQHKIDIMNKSLEEKNIKIKKNIFREVNLNFSNDNYVRPIYSQREQVQPPRKQSSRINRRSLKAKTEYNELNTNNSSIRTTQNEHNQTKSTRKTGIIGQQVTPW